MAITFTGAGTAVAASGNNPQAVTTVTAFAAGDILCALMVYDNSGGGGADPVSTVMTATPASGALGASISSQSGLNDPGSASAGLATRFVACPVTTGFASGTVVNLAWTGTVVVRAAALMKVSSSYGAGAVINLFRASSAGTASGTAATTATQATPQLNTNEALLFYAGYEYGAAVIGDADTTAGTWSSVYGTFTGSTTSGQAAYFQSKINTTGLTIQTFNPTAAVASDWVTGYITFAETVFPVISQAAYRFYDEGGEATSTALGTQSTAYSPDVGSNLNLQLRVRLQETGTAQVPNTSDFTLQYAKNGGAWGNVLSDPAILTTYPFSQYVSWIQTAVRSGQSFTGNGELLSRMAFDIHKAGTPPGTYTAVLYAHSGTFGTSSVGTGAALATSTTSAVAADFVTGFGWHFFDFNETFTLVNGTNYVMAIVATNAGDASNCVEMVYDSASPTRPGNRCDYNGTSWAAVAGTDYMTRVYTKPTTLPTNVAGHYSPALIGSTTAMVEGAATTNRLTGGTGSFGQGTQACAGLCEGHGWGASNYSEMLFGITLKSADLANSDALTFRVLKNGATTDMTYTVTPTLNVVKVIPAITQFGYRMYDDAGTESASTALAAQNTAVTGNLNVGDGFGQMRIGLQSTNANAISSTDDFTLQWEKNASGTWTNVGTGAVVGYDSPTLTEAQATTNRLTGGSGTFTAGKVAEDGVVDDMGWSGNNYTELVYSVRLVAVQFTNGDVLRFRVVKNGATADMTYTQTPTINIVRIALTPVIPTMYPRIPI